MVNITHTAFAANLRAHKAPIPHRRPSIHRPYSLQKRNFSHFCQNFEFLENLTIRESICKTEYFICLYYQLECI